MLIIDLNQPIHVKKPPKAPELAIAKPLPKQVIQNEPAYVDFPDHTTFTDRPEDEEKARLLRQLADEDARVRIQRAKLHRKYFELLTPDYLPKPGADFSVIYEQMDVLNHELQGIYIKKQMIEKHGALKVTSPVTKEMLTQLSALKHDRSNAYKNLHKWEKKLEVAKGKNSAQGITNAQAKIDEIELNILDLSHQIKELDERVKTAR